MNHFLKKVATVLLTVSALVLPSLTFAATVPECNTKAGVDDVVAKVSVITSAMPSVQTLINGYAVGSSARVSLQAQYDELGSSATGLLRSCLATLTATITGSSAVSKSSSGLKKTTTASSASSCAPSIVASSENCTVTSCGIDSRQQKTCSTLTTNADCSALAGTQTTAVSCSYVPPVYNAVTQATLSYQNVTPTSGSVVKGSSFQIQGTFTNTGSQAVTGTVIMFYQPDNSSFSAPVSCSGPIYTASSPFPVGGVGSFTCSVSTTNLSVGTHHVYIGMAYRPNPTMDQALVTRDILLEVTAVPVVTRSINFTYPTPGAHFVRGDSANVTWTSSGGPGYVSFAVVSDNGDGKKTMQVSKMNDAGGYHWSSFAYNPGNYHLEVCFSYYDWDPAKPASPLCSNLPVVITGTSAFNSSQNSQMASILSSMETILKEMRAGFSR